MPQTLCPRPHLATLLLCRLPEIVVSASVSSGPRDGQGESMTFSEWVRTILRREVGLQNKRRT